MLKNQKGITLIALVITIIVLLILAGITITMLSSQDSAPAKAVEGKAATQIGTAKDAIGVKCTENLQTFYDEKYVSNAATPTFDSKAEAAWKARLAATEVSGVTLDDTSKATDAVMPASGDIKFTITYDGKSATASIDRTTGLITWE